MKLFLYYENVDAGVPRVHPTFAKGVVIACDAVYTMPWHILIKWRINVPAGFEGGTSIHINPMTPIDLRDRLVPRLYKIRDDQRVGWLRIAEECRVDPNPLKYYLK